MIDKSEVHLADGNVWLTISELDREVIIHGVFTTEAYARQCAAEVTSLSPNRIVSVGSWALNESWPVRRS